ncbi:hypothetical protein WA026_019028 [Henosepilachna vigintioctopunctata]|uniref:EGF-like domain-containing protein n=1 Tax=Henosepilachna vigintioctopunctata TaxID=420089 RepID=A0AAW1V933_9CUCU
MGKSKVFVVTIVILVFCNIKNSVPLNESGFPGAAKCTGNEFRCKVDGSCIPIQWKCNSRPDCPDGSDETYDCPIQEDCGPEKFRCILTGKCIPSGFFCDGEHDCGVSPQFGEDLSDEDPHLCGPKAHCSWNEAVCPDSSKCIHLTKFCDGRNDCPGNSDEWDFCRNKSFSCDLIVCKNCRPTFDGPKCYCPEGQRPEGSKCVDVNECELEGTCAQICKDKIGSFDCNCVAGYEKNGTRCIAINVPKTEPPSLIFSTLFSIRHVGIDGSKWPGNSTYNLLSSRALEVIHRNHTICYIHNNMSKSNIVCANVNDLNQRWILEPKSRLVEPQTIKQISLDWISGNWYFLDYDREIIYACNSDLTWCSIIVEGNLSGPRSMALDPTRGFLFFTRWGSSTPALERCRLDGTERKVIVEHKILYPHTIALDFPNKALYWVDNYLDLVEKVDFNGKHRRTVIKMNNTLTSYNKISDMSFFENKLFLASETNNTVLELDTLSKKQRLILEGIRQPDNIVVFHRQKQPDPRVKHPCQDLGLCDHMCITMWNEDLPLKKCICAPGYKLNSKGECMLKTPSTFLLIAKSRPSLIKGIDLENGNETILPFYHEGMPEVIEFDAKTNSVFYADVQGLAIEQVKINTVNKKSVIKKLERRCDGLAFDWMSQNLYYSQSELGVIGVVNTNNVSISKTLIHNTVYYPTSIVVDPKRGIMYWVDWSLINPDDGKIYHTHMDGTNNKIFVKDLIDKPSGLTLDLQDQLLYWCDQNYNRIESIELDGKNRRIILESGMEHPLGLSAGIGGVLFFANLNKGTVMSYSNGTLKELNKGNSLIRDLKVYDSRLQKGENGCSGINNICPELCLSTPLGALCSCRDGYEYSHNMCNKIENFTRLQTHMCSSDHFQCIIDLTCIPASYQCDGKVNCPDGTDEAIIPLGPCMNVTCNPNQLKCDNICIMKEWVCDGEKDCSNGMDEHPDMCAKQCSAVQFKCKLSNRCIPQIWKCDSQYDCGIDDKSDEEECKTRECEKTEFTCKNNKCIPIDSYCNGIPDCTDGSDEIECATCNPQIQTYCSPLNSCLSLIKVCDNVTDCPDGSDESSCGYEEICEEEEFSCRTSGECIPKEYVCDSDVDCQDESDEKDCLPDKVKNVTVIKPLTNTSKCEYPSRMCDNNTRCLSVDQLCDDIIHCIDLSDEGFRCVEKLCFHSYECSHECHNAPEGLICTCPPHLHLQADKKTCLDTHPCDAWGVCSQKCIPKGSKYKCACSHGYSLKDDGFTCKSLEDSVPYVIFSNRHELRGVDLHNFALKSLIASLKNTIALDFLHTKDLDMIFWTDVIDDKIYRGTVVGGSLSNIEIVVQNGLSTAEGLAVDWIGQNLYWVESNLDQIEVAKINGSYRRTLIAGDMESPRAIAVDSRDGYLFWTDWDNSSPRIERCSLAGLDRKLVINVNQINNGGWPNGLTLDYDLRRIYWVDAKSDSIHTTDYDGRNHHEVLKNHEMLAHPFAISLFENYVYWTDWRTNSIVRANKWNGGNVSVIQRTLTQPFDIQIMHPSRQPVDAPNPCGKDNGGCSHLCLLHTNYTYRCDCPHVMKLNTDNRTCIVNEKVLLIGRSGEIRGVDITQPYYHTIPTISTPLVHSPIQIEYLANTSTLYWADSQMSEIKRSGLTLGPSITLIDTGLQHPTGLAVDWLSNIMFVSSSTGILVCNLEGEYSTNLIQTNALSVAVHPSEGRLYWVSQEHNQKKIESSAMDGTDRKIVTYIANGLVKSLTIDESTKTIYWIDDFQIHYANYSVTNGTHRKLNMLPNLSISAATVYEDYIYYADDDEQSIHRANKITGADDIILRNGTGDVFSLRIYDPTQQKGTHPCGKNKGYCQHLCLPSSFSTYSCKCATGFKTDPNNPRNCIGVEEFLFYSIGWELKGVPLDDSNETHVLGPISKVSMANTIDFIASKDLIIWADSDHGSVTKIMRDGTNRAYVIEQPEIMDNVAIDWLTCVTVDWIAENIYWGDSKRGVIVVSRLDGNNQHVLLSKDVGKPSSIAVDPVKGILVWSNGTKLEITDLTGHSRKLLLPNTSAISDISLDTENEFIYFCDTVTDTIERIRYNGSQHEIILNSSIENPVGLVVFDSKIYWIDTTHQRGSIKQAPTHNLTNYKVLFKDLGDSLKDIKIFSKRTQKGTNLCAVNNGGCQQLCLFNGSFPVCVCSHGKLNSDGKTCKDFDSFIMYSRVMSIDSVHVTDDENIHNSPHQTIKNNTHLRNAIGLAFAYKYHRLFYSDIQKGSINTVFFNGSDHKILVERQGSVEGLAYEKVHEALYWTCNNDATIRRVNLTNQMTNTTSSVETIFRLRSHDKPRGISIDSCGGRIFWTNWNYQTPSIERAYLSGFGKTSIITTDIRMPNAITLDHAAQKLYWGDARIDKIERCEYDGSDRVVIAQVSPQHPFALAVYGNYIYWTDWILHAVLRADKLTGQNVVSLRREVARPMGIVAIADDVERCFMNPCSVMNGGCEETCKLSPVGELQCACKDGYILAEDGKRCYKKLPDEPLSDLFYCSNGFKIPLNLTCDGIPHCSDSSDEEPGYCSIRTCPAGWYSCNNKRCVLQNSVCNGIDDCGDSSDEYNCSCLSDTHFKCKNGECISIKFRCDRDVDCRDASDEMGCDNIGCHDKNMIKCPNTTACIPKDWLCDNENDCWDNWDEQNCTKGNCKSNQFRCRNGTCIPSERRCDRKNDCDDAFRHNGASSDEENCGVCTSDQFTCGDSSCIPKSWECNGEFECEDHSDEYNCKLQCRSNQFRCESGECIPRSWQCDGRPDCRDQSDELEHCKTRLCNSFEFRCNSSGRCIPLDWLCDGEADCDDHNDEHRDQGCSSAVCLIDQFQCANGICINKIYFCDGDRDCDDGSDEPDKCHHNCAAGEFKCNNGKCIMDLFKCDGTDQCGDNSDEGKHCQNEEDYCRGNGWFHCGNGVCINDTLLCNGENNCGDFSDENKCNIDECTATPSPCSQKCIDKPVGYECQCVPGYQKSSKDPKLCEDVNECLHRPCGQICRNTVGSYRCNCVEPQYILRSDKSSCGANSTIQATLILANKYYIRELDLNGRSTLLVHNLSNAVALDYDWKEQCLYWSDVTEHGSSIKRLCDYKNNSTAIQTLHSPTLQNPDGLAVDWIGRNLYWCDKGVDTVEVSTLEGKYRRVLLSSGLEEPRAIALDPIEKILFWSDWGSQVHIGKSSMDGSNARIIVNSSLGWPNALTISSETQEFFWADAREDYIAVADYEGKNIRIVASRDRTPTLNLHHVFAIDVWEDFVYWTDWETKTVERCHKYRGDNCSSLLSMVHRPMDIRVVHPFRQPEVHNPCKDANCSALCLLKPQAPYYTCACPENYLLGEDGKSCNANCTNTHFECKTTYKCIPFWWKCDTQDDCGDGSDEPESCPPFNCLPGQYQCKNGNCMHAFELCNGVDNCGDNSDEAKCQDYTCLSSQFRCPGNDSIPSRCIPAKSRCNKLLDCPLGEDELNCPPVTCSANQFKCQNDNCIPAVWVCDNDNDCGDNSDELQFCKNRTCKADHFKCSSGRCIPISWKCDGDSDCSTGEDEPASCSLPEFHTCETSYFKCNNNKCIPGRWHCDYDNDCGDNSDEINCAPRNCSESEFRCGDGKCIKGTLKCDGEFHCEDKSDEVNCHVQCKKNEFQCSVPQICIFLEWKCDGQRDCTDGSDEENCHDDVCPDDGFKCNNGQCVNSDWRCDGQSDCEDGSDEIGCSALACGFERFRCKNSKCIHVSSVCDGHDQCGDNSDEDIKVCKKFKRCPPNQFTCKSGHCIEKKLRCDGQNDCEDNSDEENCQTSACQWNSCSQICIEKKNSFICKCVSGYYLSWGHHCEAKGGLADLVLATEAELRLLSPYKLGDTTNNKIRSKTLATAPGYKVYAVDLLYNNKQVQAFWTDNYNKRVQSIMLDVNYHNRSLRDVDQPRTVLSNLEDPRGISIDWVTKRLYITDGTRIIVSTMNGESSYTLIKGNMQEPRDIVVAPAQGVLFWTDWGSMPKIETAYMDGNKRRVLVNTSLLWPTSIAVDYPAERLYWADPKSFVVESIKFDGTDRQIVRNFNNETNPFKIEIFEANLFVSTYRTHNILKMHKFGKGPITHLGQGLTRISDLLIIQESKQDKTLNNVCQDFCHPSEFCLLSPHGATCTCADNYVKSNLTCKPVPNRIPSCPLNCNSGRCKIVAGQGPKCFCDPQYTGARCEHYRCSQFCKNKGMCYVDLISPKSPEALAPLRCNCLPQWTGDRCEIPVDLCVGRCSNGGTCYSPKPGLVQCSCPSGFNGYRCENCVGLTCQNGGNCTIEGSKKYCKCPMGFNGIHCENRICGRFGTPIATTSGVRCSCYNGYSGENCEQDNCHEHCQNGGTCRMGLKQPECICPTTFGGRRCEIDLCANSNSLPQCSVSCQCGSNGVCATLQGRRVCKCDEQWIGKSCDIFVGASNDCKDLCQNGGICLMEDKNEVPKCICPEKWSGPTCEQPTQCSMFCLHGGVCRLNFNREPLCDCPSGYSGRRCEEISQKQIYSSKTYVPMSSAILMVVIILVTAAAIFLIGYVTFTYFIKRRQNFTHERLQENDFSNPIYQERDTEPFSLAADKSGNFANPVYESVYNGSTSSGEEKAVLLQHSADEIPLTSIEEKETYQN